MKKELAIGLDLDGTLTDTAARHKAALVLAADCLDVHLASGFPDVFYQEKRNGMSGRHVLHRHRIVRAEEIARKWTEIIEHPSLLTMDSVYPSILDLLDAMTLNGFIFYIVTARQDETAVRKQIRNLDLSASVREVFVSRLDPNGSTVTTKHELSRHLRLQAVVGDSEVDQDWATELGVPFFGLSCGIRNKAFWSRRSVTPFDTFTAALDRLVYAIRS